MCSLLYPNYLKLNYSYQPPTHPPPALTREQRRSVFKKSLESGLAETTVDAPYPSGWFLPKNTIPKREDLIDWLLWALFSTSREETDPRLHAEELNEYLHEIEEKLLDQRLEDGHSGDKGVRSIRVNLDPVVMLHRPLLWYFVCDTPRLYPCLLTPSCQIVAMVDSYTSTRLSLLGFKHYSPQEAQWHRTFPPRPILYLLSRRAPEGVAFPYWHRPHKSSTKLPLVFMHGIGVSTFLHFSYFITLY